MCAIAGIIGYNGKLAAAAPTAETAERIIKTLKRRGPDSDGVFRSENALLIHTRLAVIDPENGAQPMTVRYGENEFTIVYNGELYNTAEVRSELEKSGHVFATSSDTEAVLRGFAEWGEDCLSRLNGIFAFAVWESKTQKLFLARDRIGVKPLFYTIKDGVLYFASEIKGLLCCDGVDAVLTADGVREIMLMGPARTCGCGVLKDIFDLKPAECAWFSAETGGQLKKRTYWDYADGAEQPFDEDFDTVKEHISYLVRDAITRQTVADVPLCTFLSGGLDSSLISSVTNRRFNEKGRKLHTFSVEYRDNQKYFKAGKFQPNSDDAYIQMMAEYLGSEHHRVVIDTPELVEALYTSTEARDLPGMADVDSSLLLFCKAVREFSTVALSGECADEIFGGYPWYRDKDIRMTDGFPWSQSTAYRTRFIRSEYLGDGFDPAQYVYGKYLDTIGKVTEKGLDPLEKRMREMMRLNMEWFMQTLLDRKDRMSMHWGLEVRVPFCDYRIVEYLYRVPWEYKDYLGREKGLLREAMSGWLPEGVLWRKKSPYPKTHNPSYENAVRERLREEINQIDCPVLDILERSEIEKLMSHGEGVQWYGQLMNDPQTMAYIIQINHWLKFHKISLQ